MMRVFDEDMVANLEAENKSMKSILHGFSPKPYWNEESQSLINRLRGFYAVGPEVSKNIGEFGYREFPVSAPIQIEATNRIEKLEEELALLKKQTIKSAISLLVEANHQVTMDASIWVYALGPMAQEDSGKYTVMIEEKEDAIYENISDAVDRYLELVKVWLG